MLYCYSSQLLYVFILLSFFEYVYGITIFWNGCMIPIAKMLTKGVGKQYKHFHLMYNMR